MAQQSRYFIGKEFLLSPNATGAPAAVVVVVDGGVILRINCTEDLHTMEII